MKQLQKRKKWREHLECLIMWEGHVECQIEYHLLRDVLLQLSLQLSQSGYLFVTLGHSSLCSHTSFNQSKPIFFPSNTVATAHKKNCSTSSNSVNSLLQKLSTNSLNTSQAGSPLFGDFPNLWYNKARK